MAYRPHDAPRAAPPARIGSRPRPDLSRPARRPARRRHSWAIFSMGVLALLLLVLTAGLVGSLLLYRSDLIPPGLQSLGVGLGGQSQATAAVALERAWSRQSVVINMGSMQQAVKPEDLGVTLDVAATARLAYQEGRSTSAIETMLRDRRLALPSTTIEPVWHFEAGRADQTLQALARQVYVPPVDATLRVANGQVQTSPSSPGRALDVGASGAVLSRDPWGVAMSGQFQPVFVSVQPRVADVSKVAAEIAPLLTAPISVHLYDAVANEPRDFQIMPDSIGDWVAVQPASDDGKDLTWTFDQERVQQYLAGQSAGLGDDRYLQMDQALPAIMKAVKAPGSRVSLRIYHKERQHAVQSGETFSSIADNYGVPYPWIQQANPGLGEALRPGQVIKIPSQDVMIPLTPVENKRIVVSLREQKMWAYENGAVKWQWPASTGMNSSPTAPGFFQIQTHEKTAYAGNWNLWMPWFMGVYRPVPNVDFMNGFHGFPSRNGNQILWTNSLGRQVTYGCILVSTDNAKLLYDWAQEGVVVEIRR